MSSDEWMLMVLAGITGGVIVRVYMDREDRPHKQRLRAIALTRPAASFAEFAAQFDGTNIQPEVVGAVYEMVQRGLARVKEFPVLASDDLCEVYAADADGDLFYDILDELLADCGKQYPPSEEGWLLDKVRTVEDLVRFVSSCPKEDSP
jgi:hypothetical protein